MSKFNRQQLVLTGVVLSAAVSAPAFAQVDTSFIAAMSTDITTVITGIGTALLAAAGLTVAYKWGKGFLFG